MTKKQEVTKQKKVKSYIAVADFKDLEDGEKVYIKDDPYPKPTGTSVSAARIKELLGTKNKLKKVLIKEQK